MGYMRLVLLSSLLTVLYPWIAGRFDRAPRAAELVSIMLANVRHGADCPAAAGLCRRRNRPGRPVRAARGAQPGGGGSGPHRFGATVGAVAAFVLLATVVSALMWRYRE